MQILLASQSSHILGAMGAQLPFFFPSAQMLISLVLMILDYPLTVCSYILGIYQDFMISPFIIDVFHDSLILIFQLLCLFFNGKINGKNEDHSIFVTIFF